MTTKHNYPPNQTKFVADMTAAGLHAKHSTQWGSWEGPVVFCEDNEEFLKAVRATDLYVIWLLNVTTGAKGPTWFAMVRPL